MQRITLCPLELPTFDVLGAMRMPSHTSSHTSSLDPAAIELLV